MQVQAAVRPTFTWKIGGHSWLAALAHRRRGHCSEPLCAHDAHHSLHSRGIGNIVPGAFTPVLARHLKSLSLVDAISVSVHSDATYGFVPKSLSLFLGSGAVRLDLRPESRAFQNECGCRQMRHREQSRRSISSDFSGDLTTRSSKAALELPVQDARQSSTVFTSGVFPCRPDRGMIGSEPREDYRTRDGAKPPPPLPAALQNALRCSWARRVTSLR